MSSAIECRPRTEAPDPGKDLSGNLASTFHMLRTLGQREAIAKDECSRGLVDACIELVDECRRNVHQVKDVVRKASRIVSMAPEEDWW